MKKKITDMTVAEKQGRIDHLLLKFYDINTTPSLILHEEMQYAIEDANILHLLDKLEQLEIKQHKLSDVYSATVARQIQPLKRRLEYAQSQIIKQQEQKKFAQPVFNPLNRFVTQSSDEEYKQKLADLQRKHRNQVREIELAASTELNECKEQLHNVFIDAVRYLYR